MQHGEDLLVVGTPAADDFVIDAPAPGQIAVTRNVTSLGTFTVAGRVHVFGGAGDDTVTINAAPAGGVSLDGQGGSDSYTVNFGGLTGLVDIADTGTGGTDTVVVNRTAGGDVITIAKSDGVSVATRTNSADAPVNCAGVEEATIDGAAGDDSLIDPGGADLTLRGGPGNDHFEVRDTTGPVRAEDSQGTNSYVITMGNLGGPVTIANTGGTSTLTIEAPPEPTTLTLSATGLTGGGETVNLDLGSTATGLILEGDAGTQVVLDGAPPAPVTAPGIAVMPGAVAVPVAPVAHTTGVSVSVPFTTAAGVTVTAVEWSWGDGATSAGAVSQSGMASGTHTYAAAGVYTVTARLITTTGAVIHDNKVGFPNDSHEATELGGGSIVIHK